VSAEFDGRGKVAAGAEPVDGPPRNPQNLSDVVGGDEERGRMGDLFGAERGRRWFRKCEAHGVPSVVKERQSATDTPRLAAVTT